MAGRASGFRSMAWFQGQSGGSHFAWDSENTLRYCLYSNGIVFNSLGEMLYVGSSPVSLVRILTICLAMMVGFGILRV